MLICDLKIVDAPKIYVQTLIVNQMVGYHTEMSCQSTSSPPVTQLSWYFKPYNPYVLLN